VSVLRSGHETILDLMSSTTNDVLYAVAGDHKSVKWLRVGVEIDNFIDFCLIPMGTSEVSVAEYIAKVSCDLTAAFVAALLRCI
jgi:hypothetical protein